MHDIVHELTVAAPAEQVFDAVATAAGLATWWSSEVTITGGQGSDSDDQSLTDGSTFEVGFDQGAVIIKLQVDSIVHPVLSHLTCIDGPAEWPGTQLAFRVEPDNHGGTVVRFWHGGWEFEDGALPRCSFQWALYLDNLRRVLEGGDVHPQ